MTSEKIIKNLAQVKLDIGQSVDSLENSLTEEYRKLNNIQEAIKIESCNLQELHNITANTDSLAALFLAQKEYKQKFEEETQDAKNNFEKEMNEVRASGEKEQEDYIQNKKEQEIQIKKNRERKEEEYNYNLQLERKKNQDDHQTRKNLLEKELEEKLYRSIKRSCTKRICN